MNPAPKPDLDINLEATYARELPELSTPVEADPIAEPELVALNLELADALGIDPETIESAEGLAMLAGGPDPGGIEPVAMAYAGHQFGGYSPILGDGRAMLMGEVLDRDGRRFDVHLKGTGRTPFSRGGDGKAELGSMLREFLIASAMDALDVPTAKALAVLSTGEHIVRAGPVPGAVLARVASSHIRVGTFEYAARHPDETVLKRLADYTINRHYPAAAETAEHRYLALFEAVVDAQAELVAKWMAVGFIHGVMNTDNVTLSGETIDYGPCAFLDRYDPDTVYSSIDHASRYSYGHQPAITQWNLARFGETLLPLINPDSEVAAKSATDILMDFPARYEREWLAAMRAKLGLLDPDGDDRDLIERLLKLMQSHRVDYTNAFRALANSLRNAHDSLDGVFGEAAPIGEWLRDWRARLEFENRDLELAAKEMDQINPIYIPRNHLVEEALEAAGNGDLEPFGELLEVVVEPYNICADRERYGEPAPESFNDSYQTFCGT